jgi:Galactose oxidase, central domain
MKQRQLFALGLFLAVCLPLTSIPAWAAVGGAGSRSAPDVSTTWTPGTPITFGFPTPGATRFDGELYRPQNRVYFLGFRNPDNSTDGSVWYYDVATKTYHDTGVDMPVPVSNYGISALTDRNGVPGLYIFGGRDNAGLIVTTVQAYFPNTNTTGVIATDPWPGTTPQGCVSLPAMGVVTASNHAIVLGGAGFSTGGCVVDDNSAQTWIYFPTANAGARWKPGPALNMARGYITGAAIGKTIYAFGGDINQAGTLLPQQIAEKWTIGTPSWNDAGVLDVPVLCDETQAFAFASGPLANNIVLAGCGQWGQPVQAIPDTYVYNAAANTWTNAGALNEARRNHAGVFIGSKMFVLGGYASDGVTVIASTETGAASPLAARPGFARPGSIRPASNTGAKPTTT